MSKEELKIRIEVAKQLAVVIWQFILIPLLYTIFMWASLVVGVFLVFGDFWRAAGIVSAFTLFQIIQKNFNREFFGSRNHYGI